MQYYIIFLYDIMHSIGGDVQKSRYFRLNVCPYGIYLVTLQSILKLKHRIITN